MDDEQYRHRQPDGSYKYIYPVGVFKKYEEETKSM